MTDCSIEGCDGKVRARGWCQAHYMRWFTNGEVGGPIVRRPKGRICSVEGCERKYRINGYCDAHHQRVLKYGEPGSAEIEPRRPDAICAVDGCEKTIRRGGRGWCNAHYLRWKKTGDPATPLLEHPPHWTGDAATYNAVHLRIRKAKGKARDHACVDCGLPANHWSYDHKDPNERHDDRGRPYSTDMDHYQARCHNCHKDLDVFHGSRCAKDGCNRQPTKSQPLCSEHRNRRSAKGA